jgi:MFS family permease
MSVAQPSRHTERLLAPAAFVTSLGNNVQLIAGAMLMVRTAHTMLAVGLLFIAVAVPQAVLSPYFGRLADRHDRRLLWIGCDAASAVLALALPVWLTLGGAAGPGVYAANFALAVVAALFFPVSNALIKERVAAARVRRFNARYEMATQAGMVLSATVGGVMVQMAGAVPLLYFNAGTFVVSALFLVAVGPRPDRPGIHRPGVHRPGVHRPGADVHESGADGVPAAAPPRSRVPLARLILLYAQGNVVVTVFNALLPKLVLGEWHRGAGMFGAVDAVGSLGFLGATWFSRHAVRRHGDLRVALAGFLFCDLTFVFQPLAGPAGIGPLVALGAFVYCTARISSRNLVMTSVDEAYVGRAFGLANAGGLAATVAVMLAVAETVDHSDARWGFGLCAALSAVAAIAAGLLLRGFSDRPEPMAAPAEAAPALAVTS